MKNRYLSSCWSGAIAVVLYLAIFHLLGMKPLAAFSASGSTALIVASILIWIGAFATGSVIVSSLSRILGPASSSDAYVKALEESFDEKHKPS